MKEASELYFECLTEFFSSEKPKEMVMERIEKSFEDAIDSSFRFGKARDKLREVAERSIDISVNDIHVESYTEVMRSALKEKLLKFKHSEAVKRFTDELDDFFKPAPKEISIGDLLQKIIESMKTDDPCSCTWGSYANVEFAAEDENESWGPWYTLKVSNGEKYSRDEVSLRFDKDRLRISHNMEYNPTCMYGIDAYIFHLYAAGTKITGLDEFDPDDYDLSLSDADY